MTPERLREIADTCEGRGLTYAATELEQFADELEHAGKPASEQSTEADGSK